MTDEEHANISMWAEAKDAYAWAVNVGACKHIEHARNSMKNVIDKHGGRLTAENKVAMFLAFYRRQIEKLAEQEVKA